MRRLLATFLPQTPIVLATLLATSLYAATMTARVGLIYPVMRLFVEDITPEEEERLGGAAKFVRTFTKQDGEFNQEFFGPLNGFLDRMDSRMLSAIEKVKTIQDPKRRLQIGTLATALFLFLCVALLSALANFAKLFFRALLVVRVLISLRVRLLQNLLCQPLAFYNDQKRGELISRMSSDVQSSTICLQTMTGPIVEQTLLILGPVCAIVLVQKWLFVIVATFLVGVFLSLRKQTRKVHRRAKIRQRTIAKVTEAMVQMFSGIRVVKAFGLEREKVDQYTKRNQDFSRDAMATEVAKAWTRTRMEFFTHMAIVLAITVAMFVLGSGGNLPAGAMFLFLGLMAQIYTPTKRFTHAYTDVQDHMAGAGRVFEFMDLTPSLSDKRDAIRLEDAVGTVRFEDVSFSYNGGENGKVLEHVNLEVPAGQVVALVGHSGAGKSTLVNLVPRFYDPDSGRITIDGTDVREFTRESLLENIAIVTQEPFLFNCSIRENVAYGKPGASGEEVVAAAKAANIHDFITTLPRGYDTQVGDRGTNLSGGQCQRITIARAVIRNATILILDEATSNLDTESERAVQVALQNLMRGRTTLVIAHRLSTVQHADKICVMQDGRICEVGSHDQLLASDSLYRRLYDMQFARD